VNNNLTRMDPVTLITNLATACIQIRQGMNSLVDKYATSSHTLKSIANQCTILSASLECIRYQVINGQNNPDNKVTRAVGSNEVLSYNEALENILITCEFTLQELDQELRKYSNGDQSDKLDFKAKIKCVLEEDKLRAKLVDLQGQAGALNLLYTAKQT
jgi:hypothetical protein